MTTDSKPDWANLPALAVLRVLAAAGGSAAGIAATVCRSWREAAASEKLWHELCNGQSIQKDSVSTWAGTYAKEARTRLNWQHGQFRTTQWSPQGPREGHWVTGVYMFKGFTVLLQNVICEGEQMRMQLDVWDGATGAHLHELQSWGRDPDFQVLISGHRDRLVGCDGTGAMRLWHIPSGRLLTHAIPDNPFPLVVRVEMDDIHLVTAHMGGNSVLVRTWDAHHLGMLSYKRWREVGVAMCFGLYRNTVEFAYSMTGRNITDEDLTLCCEIIVWDLFARERVFSVALKYDNTVNALFMDVNTIYGCVDTFVCLWDKATQQPLRTLCLPNTHVLRYNPAHDSFYLTVHKGWMFVGMSWVSESGNTDLNVFFAPVEPSKGSWAKPEDDFAWERVLDGTDYITYALVSLTACWPTICAVGISSDVGMLTASPAATGT